MALAGRSARRGGTGIRWIAIGLVITILVLLVDAAMNSRAPDQVQSLGATEWVDKALPVIQASNAQGLEIQRVWSDGLHTPASSISSLLTQISSQSAAEYRSMSKLRPPVELNGPAGLLEAALLARSQAAAHLVRAFALTLGPAASATVTVPTTAPVTPTTAAAGPGAAVTTAVPTTAAPTTTTTAVPAASAPPAALNEVTAALSDIRVGDDAYGLFLSAFPATLKLTMPPSTWGADPAPYDPANASVFLTTLQASTITTPLHQAKVVSIITNPAAVSSSGGVETLPDATAITLDIVVANIGNQSETNLTVRATIAPAGSGSSSVVDFVNLSPGQAYTINGLGPLNPPIGTPVTLTVTVTSQSGALPPTSSTLTFIEPDPNATTTTTAPPTTTPPTTAPAG